MERKGKLALFDMDQTLVESDFAWAEAFMEYADHKGFERPEEFRDQFYEKDFEHLLERIIERHPEESRYTIFERVADLAMVSYRERVELRSGAAEIVETMRRTGYIAAVLTANNPRLSEVARERFQGILGIDHWYCAQALGMSKADSAIYDFLSDLHGIDKSSFVLFDDASYAVETAYEAGIKVIKIYNPRDCRKKEGFPYPVLESLHEFDLSMIE